MVPVCASAMPAVCIVLGPHPQRCLRLHVARVPCRIPASVALTPSRRFIAIAWRIGWRFGDESTALRIIQFNVPAYFSVLEFAEYVADRDKREWQVTSGVLHHKHHVEFGRDAFANAAHGRTELFSDKGAAETGMRRQGTIESSIVMMQCVEFNNKGL
eukprot:4716693-Pleurochrysis_carterae.AAC.1